METVVKLVSQNEDKKNYKDDKIFLQEFGKCYLVLELMEKNSRLSEYLCAYQEIDNKDSFKAQYLEYLIELIKQETKVCHH